jgi:hypothetical protein
VVSRNSCFGLAGREGSRRVEEISVVSQASVGGLSKPRLVGRAQRIGRPNKWVIILVANSRAVPSKT